MALALPSGTEQAGAAAAQPGSAASTHPAGRLPSPESWLLPRLLQLSTDFVPFVCARLGNATSSPAQLLVTTLDPMSQDQAALVGQGWICAPGDVSQRVPHLSQPTVALVQGDRSKVRR